MLPEVMKTETLLRRFRDEFDNFPTKGHMIIKVQEMSLRLLEMTIILSLKNKKGQPKN